MLIGWWGAALGAVLLAWAIAGAIGKMKGPLNLLFPDSGRTALLAAVGIGLAVSVTTCGAMGGVAEYDAQKKEAREAQEKADSDAAEKEKREKQKSEAAAVRAKHEAELNAKAGEAAKDYAAKLDAVESLTQQDKWQEAGDEMKEVTASIGEYKQLDPIPEEIAALMPRHDLLTSKLDANRRVREAVAWIERAEAVVGEKGKCQDPSEVKSARKQVEGLVESDPGYTRVQELNAELDACLKNMPPPSKWLYDMRADPMGGTVSLAAVQSSNMFDFDFPYQGTQQATLMVRHESGTDIILSIERGQFTCALGCSVMVRFDDGKTERWRAVGPSDHSTESIFLRRESSFMKKLKKARTLRIEAEFFQEGTRVLEFPVARFDPSKLN
ncbi:hypothetical protein [Plesiocystis pacifica]|uniref:hypothetical protein n=1 Tax=Plesiocystis pacifica TaxID=191768 RepID=UPI0012F9363F|nr:hypothetical protein [Plesiocystis pacifica]